MAPVCQEPGLEGGEEPARVWVTARRSSQKVERVCGLVAHSRVEIPKVSGDQELTVHGRWGKAGAQTTLKGTDLHQLVLTLFILDTLTVSFMSLVVQGFIPDMKPASSFISVEGNRKSIRKRHLLSQLRDCAALRAECCSVILEACCESGTRHQLGSGPGQGPAFTAAGDIQECYEVTLRLNSRAEDQEPETGERTGESGGGDERWERMAPVCQEPGLEGGEEPARVWVTARRSSQKVERVCGLVAHSRVEIPKSMGQRLCILHHRAWDSVSASSITEHGTASLHPPSQALISGAWV
ncbi:hypothetical protein EOD39_20921 [Acipenser ruthenus]|uniref:Uncharacterized protein n=1 Tax=Acipenser ruthenus TaxID=7906 RepID=A0A444UU75_ACIRT|nr:hypothetical protein EOD39_20921 [Acipenser ruthenus]